MGRHVLKRVWVSEPTDVWAAAGPARDLDEPLAGLVRGIIDDVRQHGDAAVREYSQKFDDWSPDSFLLSPEDRSRAVERVPRSMTDDFVRTQERVRRFAEAELAALGELDIETDPGVRAGHVRVPVDSVGVYVPPVSDPASAAAVAAVVTARAAGVPRVVACTPPVDGEIPLVPVAALQIAGADEIYVLGGVPAVTALGLGTETIGAVDLVAGPGGADISEAKRQLSRDVGIDLYSESSEILILADDSADSLAITRELLAPLRFDGPAMVVLVSTSERLAGAVMDEVSAELEREPADGALAGRWEAGGEVYVVGSVPDAVELVNELAPALVGVFMAGARSLLGRLRNVGLVVLGDVRGVPPQGPTLDAIRLLPTGRGARYTSGLWVGKFVKTVSFRELTTDSTAGAPARSGRTTRGTRRAAKAAGPKT